MMKYLLLLFAGIMCRTGQIAAQMRVVTEERNQWLIKLGPLGMLSTDGGPELSVEYLMVQKRMGLQLEIQPIFVNPWRIDENDGNAPENTIRSSHPLGIRVRPEFRYYLYQKPKRYPWIYLSLDAEYKYTDIKRYGTLPVYNGGSSPAYFMDVAYNDIKKVYGFHLKSGMLIPFGDSRFLFEMSYGMGVKYRDFSYKNIPIGVSDPERPINDFGVTQGDGWIFSVPLAVRFGYRF